LAILCGRPLWTAPYSESRSKDRKFDTLFKHVLIISVTKIKGQLANEMNVGVLNAREKMQ